jgi:hypothetical protein
MTSATLQRSRRKERNSLAGGIHTLRRCSYNLLGLVRAINLKAPFGRNVRISVRLCLQLEGGRR